MTYVLADMDTFECQNPSPLDILLEKEEISLDNPEIGDIIEGTVKEFDMLLDLTCCEMTMSIKTHLGEIDITRIATEQETRLLNEMDIMGKECDLIFTREGWTFRNLYMN